MHEDDWGGGYYPLDLQQADFNQNRLLMFWLDNNGSTGYALPYSSVWGVGYNYNAGGANSPPVLKMVPVGRSDMTTRQPQHL
jgi:hypothetical protein